MELRITVIFPEDIVNSSSFIKGKLDTEKKKPKF